MRQARPALRPRDLRRERRLPRRGLRHHARRRSTTGGRVRGIRVPGGGALSRKAAWTSSKPTAKNAGRAGLLAAQARERRARGSGREVPRRRTPRRGSACSDGDLALLVAGPDHVSSPALDRVRQEVARRARAGAGERERASSGSWTSRCSSATRRRARSAPCIIRSRRRIPRTLPLLDTAPETVRARSPTTSCSTAPSSAAAASGSPIRALQRRVFALLGIADDDGAGALRLPARGTSRGRAAARRLRVRVRPHRDAARRARRRCAT